MHIDNPARYPAFIAGVLIAGIAVAISLGVHMTKHTEGDWDALIMAAAGVATGCFVRPFPVPALLGFINAAVIVGIAYRVPHVSPELATTLGALVLACFSHAFGSPRLEKTPRGPIPVE